MKSNPLQRVIERACTDAMYRMQLITKPRQVLADAGIEVPADVDVRVHEPQEDRLMVVLPTAHEVALGESKKPLPVGPVSDVPEGLALEWLDTLNLPRRTLVVRGRIDATTAPALRREIERAFSDIDLDFSGVQHMSSAGIGALVAGQQTLRGRDCSMCLRLVSEKIQNMMELSGLLDIFEISEMSSVQHFMPKGAGVLFGSIPPM